MKYLALASDYDGTLASEGRVDATTLAAIARWRESGRQFILVTGRLLEDLLQVFPEIHCCDRVVVENGAVVYDPATGQISPLGNPPPPEFIQQLRDRGVDLSVGRVILATESPYETPVREAIAAFGLNLNVSLNKGAVMIQPAGLNKVTGLTVALSELGLTLESTIGIGDAENDLDFILACNCAVAVANALPSLKQQADWVTTGECGAGVIQLIDRAIDE